MAAEPARAPLRVLRADGQRIDLTSRAAGQALAAGRQAWQSEAMDYRDMIGELRYAVRLQAREVARVRFYPAATRPWPQDPAPLDGDDHGLDPQLVADAIANFNRIPFDNSPDGFTSRLAENLGLVGEAWIHIDADDVFHVRSVSEIKATSDGKVTIQTLPGGGAAATRTLNPDSEELLRLWIGHPEWAALADAPMRALLDVCEDVVLAGREARAAARSRLAANGVLLVPHSLSMATTRDEDDDPAEDSFMADFTTAMLASVRDDGEPQAVVPIVLRGDIEDLEKVRHVTMSRADAADLVERQSSALLRMLKGLDIQPEQVDGVGAVNHWTGWLIDSRSVKQQVEPAATSLGMSTVQAYLRPALESLGHPADQVRRIVIAVDVSPLAENPNRGQDARDAHAAFAISDSKLREALGFDDDDAPDDQEVMRRLATSGRLSVTDTAEILGVAKPGAPVTVDGQVTKPALPAVEEPRPVARPGEVQAEQPVPDTMPDPGAPAIVAAADPQLLLRCDPDLSRRLADIDAALTDRILVAADAALARVLERAGARVRSAAQKDRTPGVVASLRGLDAARIPATLGRERVATFVPVADLVTDEHTRLRAQVLGWLQGAADDTGRVVCALLDLDPAGDGRAVTQLVRSRLLADLDGAWAVFAQALTDTAEEALFDETPDPTGTLLAAEDVAEFLAAAGGSAVVAAGRHRRARSRHELPAGADSGFATGPLIVRTVAEAGAVLIGREWSWRAELVRDAYEPHQDLDGLRFASWDAEELRTGPGTDWVGSHYRPGDHRGCFVAGTVVSGPLAFASFARPYKGEGVEIRTESGKVLTGTPNHPILTPNGWVALGELGEGDEVVVASGEQGALAVDDEAHQVPALIEDVAAALPMADGVVSRPVPTAAEDFHGDGAGSDGQVTVVRADRRLLLDDEVAPSQLGGDHVLQFGDERLAVLSTAGVAKPLFPGEALAAHRSVGGGGDSLPLLDGGVVVSDVLGFAAVAGDDARLVEDASNHGAAGAVSCGEREFAGAVAVVSDDLLAGGGVPARSGLRISVSGKESVERGLLEAELAAQVGDARASGPLTEELRQRRVVSAPALRDAVVAEDSVDGVVGYPIPTREVMDRFTGGVATEKVVEIRRAPLDCHVYNLSTTTGWYVANGVIVHNCRCVTVPLFAIPADPEVRAQLRAAAGDPRRIPATGFGARLRDRLAAAVESLRATVLSKTKRTSR